MSTLTMLYWLARAALTVWAVERRDVIAAKSACCGELRRNGARRSAKTRLICACRACEALLWVKIGLPYPQGTPGESSTRPPCGCTEVE